MKSTRVILGALAAFAAFSLPAFAGEPGPYLKPYHPPVKTTTSSSSYSTSYSHSSSSYATSDLNRQAYDDLSRRQATAPKYVYTRPAPQPVNPCYQPNPCAAPQTTYTTGAVTRTYTQTPTTTYRAPAPVNPCYQPNPCGTRTQTYTQPTPAYVPPPAYAPPPPYIPPPAPPQWLAVNDCGHKVIRRLKDGRDGERRYEVCYSDLNHLSAYDRNSTLLERIELASRKACDDHGFSFYSRRGERKCRTDSTEDAIYAANVPGLVEFYYAKTGKRRPNVQVGAPIYY